MNINFSPVSHFNKVQNLIKPMGFASNPIKFQGNLTEDKFESSVKLSPEDIKEKQVEKRIEDLDIEKKNLSKDFGNRIISESEYTSKSRKIREEKKACKEELNRIKEVRVFKEMQATRPNVAFLYDPDTTIEEKKQELQNHPEFVSVDDIKENNPEIGEDLSGIRFAFIIDQVGGSGYIDTTDEKNAENYEILKENIGDYVSLSAYARKNGIPEKFLQELTSKKSLDTIRLKNKTTSQGFKLNLVPKEIEDKADNIKKLIPQESKYYKKLLRNSNEPHLVPLMHLSKLGYGTPQEIYAQFKKGNFEGTESNVVRDGKVKKAVFIDVSSTDTENLLETMRNFNKNYSTIEDLANGLQVKPRDIEKAIIAGDLVPNNEYIFPGHRKSIGINLDNPKNAEYVNKLIFEHEIENQILQTEKTQSKRKNKTMMGLRSKIAWHLAPNTKNVASEIAHQDGYIAKILEKEARIDKQDENTENPEYLTRTEQITLNRYRKNFWQMAGTEEFSSASKIASDIVKAYQTSGIDAIEDPEIKQIIADYLS